MVAMVARVVVGSMIGLGFVALPACWSEPPASDLHGAALAAPSSSDAARAVDEIRSAFQVPPPEASQRLAVMLGVERATSSARDAASSFVVGESSATGFERTPAGLRATGGAPVGVDLALPLTADGARQLRSGGVAISARLRGASPARAEIAGGYVLYRDTLGPRVSIVEQVRPDGVEDFLHFPERPSSEAIAYDLGLDAGVGGLRLVANTLEVLDLAGVPRLRVNPPFAIGADGVVVAATLSVAGCAVDTSPAIPSAVRVAPGASSCAVHLAWRGVTYPALVDPAWVATSSMAFARVFPTSSLVIDDRHVLVTGGYDLVTGALSSAEIFDTATGAWSATGSMADKRYAHQQVLLGDGTAFVTGGLDYTLPYVASSEEYNAATGTWGHRALMASGRYDFPLVMLAGKPIVVGGWSVSALAACEQYDPVVHSWSPFATMAVPRGGAAAVSHGAGAFVVSGGYNPTAGYLASSELYSTAVGVFWTGGTMTSKRAYHLANPVTFNPQAMVTGGANATGSLKSAEVYYGSFVFPQPGFWSAIADMSEQRLRHQTVNLTASRVMACGGTAGPLPGTASCETFDSFTFRWTADCTMTAPRSMFTMLVVPSIGRSLAAGGHVLSSAEISCGSHDKCTSGDALAGVGGSCEASVCAVDPFCCTTAWDGACVAEVRTVCGSLACPESTGTCEHTLCTEGASLASTCDKAKANCVAAICAVDSFCCTSSWDAICVNEVDTVCGKNCE